MNSIYFAWVFLLEINSEGQNVGRREGCWRDLKFRRRTDTQLHTWRIWTSKKKKNLYFEEKRKKMLWYGKTDTGERMSPASICPHTCLDKTKLVQQGLKKSQSSVWREKRSDCFQIISSSQQENFRRPSSRSMKVWNKQSWSPFRVENRFISR